MRAPSSSSPANPQPPVDEPPSRGSVPSGRDGVTAAVLEEIADDMSLLDGLVRAAERAKVSGGVLAAIRNHVSCHRERLRRVQAVLEGGEPPHREEERTLLQQIRDDLETGERILESIAAMASGGLAAKAGETRWRSL